MRHSLSRNAGFAAGMVVLLWPVWLQGQDAGSDQLRVDRRTEILMSRSGKLPEVGPTISVLGSIWSPDEVGVPHIVVRLRDLVAGAVAAVTTTSETGDFAFEQLGEGTYVIEVADTEDGSPIAFGDVFTIGPEETVAVFLKLPRALGWASTLEALLGPPGSVSSGLTGTFGTTAGTVVSSAAIAGVLSFGGGRAASNEDQP